MMRFYDQYGVRFLFIVFSAFAYLLMFHSKMCSARELSCAQKLFSTQVELKCMYCLSISLFHLQVKVVEIHNILDNETSQPPPQPSTFWSNDLFQPGINQVFFFKFSLCFFMCFYKLGYSM